MNPQQLILAEYTRLLEGMYQRTNYKTRAIGKQTWKGGFNAGLDASLDILKIVLKESGTIKTTNGKN